MVDARLQNIQITFKLLQRLNAYSPMVVMLAGNVTVVSRLLKKPCFEISTLKIIGVFAWFFIEKVVFQQPARGKMIYNIVNNFDEVDRRNREGMAKAVRGVYACWRGFPGDRLFGIRPHFFKELGLLLSLRRGGNHLRVLFQEAFQNLI